MNRPGPVRAAGDGTGGAKSTAAARAPGAVKSAAESRRPPVASVRLDSPLPHLDRPFDYSVPAALVDAIEVGSRVRVPFAGRLVNGVVTRLPRTSSFGGDLSPIRSASAIPSYTPAAIKLAERIARRYGGSVWDVLRLMAPPRAAAVEKRDWDDAPRASNAEYSAASRRATAAPLAREGERVVWEALPDEDPRTS
ncbi:MAG: primosomal protein N', partial [Demequina sp.]